MRSALVFLAIDDLPLAYTIKKSPLVLVFVSFSAMSFPKERVSENDVI